jgi:hypothetical protein
MYIGRVVDAIDAALSKHDQVFIPATTRLGRVRAMVPTCVACDRPLTTKSRRYPDNEKPGTAGGKNIETSFLKTYYLLFHNFLTNNLQPIFRIGDTKPDSHPKIVTASFAKNEIKPFVMRGGFKMPSL